ncbi:MAG: N-6 DNA methylase [Acidimicrobiia bacterium]|nr:N-6 DNA methylase [Acidimicrobiia bacterium]
MEAARRYLGHLRTVVDDGAPPATILSAVARHLGQTLPRRGRDDLALLADDLAGTVVVDRPPATLEPADLGVLHEGLVSGPRRKAQGVYFTPATLATRLVRFAVADSSPSTVCDPAVGGGAFLVGAARMLHTGGLGRRRVVEECLSGATSTPSPWRSPSSVCGRGRARRATPGAPPPPDPRRRARRHPRLPRSAVGGIRPRGRESAVPEPAGCGHEPLAGSSGPNLRARFGPDVGGYVDAAGLFLLAGAELARSAVGG